jgi:uncharacterized glyoxalase superfamily protein PhnB
MTEPNEQPLQNLGAISAVRRGPPAAKDFYADAVGHDSAVFDFGNTINLLDVREAPELLAPERMAWPDAGPRFQLTIRVEDADAVCRQLRARGVTLLNGPQDRPWGQRTAAFRDPAGHVWEIAQQIPRSGS